MKEGRNEGEMEIETSSQALTSEGRPCALC